VPDDIDGLQLKNTPFRLFDNLIDHAETEFGENYSHKMAFLNRTGRKTLGIGQFHSKWMSEISAMSETMSS